MMLKKSFKFTSALIMLISTVFILCMFQRLYEVSKQNIIVDWRNKSKDSLQKFSYYMKLPIDAISFSAHAIQEMCDKEISLQEVKNYIVNETRVYSSIINENTTGVYTYYKDNFIDGSGWVPPEEYEPRNRPWYSDALMGDGRIVISEPHVSNETNKLVMSVSKVLNDKVSVVSMDIFLDGVQKIVENASDDPAVVSSFVIDKKGIILAHTDKYLVCKDMYYLDSSLKNEIYKRIKDSDEPSFEMHNHEGKYLVFIEKVNKEWSYILILDEENLYFSLSSIFFITALSIFFILTIFYLAFVKIGKKYEEVDFLNTEIMAVSNIYLSMLRINLYNDTYEIIRKSKEFEFAFEGLTNEYSGNIKYFSQKLSRDLAHDILPQFLETAHLSERLGESLTISQEFLDYRDRWTRARYIVVNRDSQRRLHYVLLAFESIDEDKRQQEKLRMLSQIDIMTGVFNRGCGESSVRQAMVENRLGMFCLLDADKFKSINDTYGHSVGDKVIISIAKSLKKTFRETDIVFRLGGDEFCVYSEGVLEERTARRIFDRLFANVSAIVIPEMGNTKIYLSAGVTFFTDISRDTFEDMYQRADKGTYLSKKIPGNFATFVFPENQ